MKLKNELNKKLSDLNMFFWKDKKLFKIFNVPKYLICGECFIWSNVDFIMKYSKVSLSEIKIAIESIECQIKLYKTNIHY